MEHYHAPVDCRSFVFNEVRRTSPFHPMWNQKQESPAAVRPGFLSLYFYCSGFRVIFGS